MSSDGIKSPVNNTDQSFSKLDQTADFADKNSGGEEKGKKVQVESPASSYQIRNDMKKQTAESKDLAAIARSQGASNNLDPPPPDTSQDEEANDKSIFNFKNFWSYLIDQKKDFLTLPIRSVLDFVVDDLTGIVAKIASAGNFVGAAVEALPFGKKIKDYVEEATTWLTRFSFFPYGLQGFVNGLRKKNLIQAIAFLGEPIFNAFGNLRNSYLLRGLPTGTDQLPVATEFITKKKYPSLVFPDYMTGVKEVMKASWQLLTEISPGKIFTLKPKGHSALISSIGSITASLGYMLTGKERFFGTLRDISAFFVDWEMIWHEDSDMRKAGFFFIIEEAADFIARAAGKYRLIWNQISHGCGRLALNFYQQFYKNSVEEGQKYLNKETEVEVPA